MLKCRRAILALLLASTATAQPIPKPEELGPWIDAGDPRAVPIILARLRDAASRSQKDDTDRYYMLGMIQHAGMYQLDEAGWLMVRLYDRAERDSSEINVIAYEVSRYRSEAARGLQRALVTDPRLIDSDLRAMLLIALAETGDDKAADALADWTAEILTKATVDNTVTMAFAEAVPTTRSKHFMDRINALPTPPQPMADDDPVKASQAKRCREMLERLRGNLAVANGSIEGMLEFIANAPKGEISRVDTAFRCLGKFAEPKDVPAILKVKFGKDNCLVQNDRIVDARELAIAAIKRRNWPYYAEQATTMPGAR